MILIGTVALEEDAQILRVIEAYCTGASLHQTTTGMCLCKNYGSTLFDWYFFNLSNSNSWYSHESIRFIIFVRLYTAVRKECVPQVLLPEEEKIIVEEMKSNGQTVIEEKYDIDLEIRFFWAWFLSIN